MEFGLAMNSGVSHSLKYDIYLKDGFHFIPNTTDDPIQKLPIS